MVDWQQALEQKWAALRFGEVKVETNADQHVFEVEVFLDDLDPKAVRVELYADGINGGDPVRQEMKRARATGRRVGRLRLQRGGACGPPGGGLYGASDTATATAWRSRWKTLESCGSDDPSTEEKTMKKATAITCMFVDIGGVLLTDGWDHHARKRAAENFKLEWAEIEDRHQLTFDTYEEGKLTLEEYLYGWSSTGSDRSPGLSFGVSCLRNRNPIPR